MGSLSVAGGAKKACVFSLCQKKKWHHNSNFRLLPSFVPSPTFAPRTKKTKKQKMDAALDKVAAAVDKAEPAVEKAVRSALGDKAGDAVHKAAETVKDALKDDVRELFFFFCNEGGVRRERKKTNLSHPSLSLHPSPLPPVQTARKQQQAKRAQISEVAGKAQAQLKGLVGEAKK